MRAVSEIFSATANFSRMAKNSEGLYVKEIHHKVISCKLLQEKMAMYNVFVL